VPSQSPKPEGAFFKQLVESNKKSKARQSTNSDLMGSLMSSDDTSGGVSSDTIGASAGGSMTSAVLNTGAGNSSIVDVARKYIGVPYVAGGRTPKSGMDCSGYTAYVLNKALGIKVPALSGLQAQRGTKVNSLKDAQPGDLLFFDLGERDTYKGIDHVAIYLGNGKMIEAPRPGKNIGEVKVYHPPKFIRRFG
jgi:peptidoglycan DL-endopeptidase CwlO